MRSGSVSDLDFEHHPVVSVAVFAHWLVAHAVSTEDAVSRLRATRVGSPAMRAAAELMTESGRQDDAPRRAQHLLLRAAHEPPHIGDQWH